MSPDATRLPRIAPIPPGQHPQALALVLQHAPEAERRQQMVSASAAGGEGGGRGPRLLGAYRGHKLVGAALAEVQAGRMASVWPPRLVTGEPATTAVGLVKELLRLLGKEEVRLAQGLLEGGAAADEEAMSAGGLRRLSELLYLVSPNSAFPTSPPVSPLEFEPYSPANHRRLAEIVQATYQQTRDCPGLNGVRNVEDVLAGYRGTGVFDPGRWLIVREGGSDVGCLLLNDFPEYDNWELTYMGVAPRARGSGWGIEMVRTAQWRTRLAGRSRLVLAVDAENEPALKLYAAAGFQAWDRRTVLVKVFG
jgi:GNAT superfamily N-acetyltransferase